MDNKNKEMESYWLGELTEPLPRLGLSYDKTPDITSSFKGDIVTTNVGSSRMERLATYVQHHHTTEESLFLSCQFALLYKLTGDLDMLIGTSVMSNELMYTQHLNGQLPNGLGLPIRVNFDERIRFSDLLQQVEEKCLYGLRNSQYLFEELVTRFDSERVGALDNAPYISMFRYRDSNSPHYADVGASLAFSLQCRKDDNDVTLQMVYDTSLFRADTIEHYMRYYLHIVDQVLDDPDIGLVSIGLLTEQDTEERLMVCFDFSMDYVRGQLTAHKQFEQQTVLTPEAPAIVYKRQIVTYRELNARANRLARTLRGDGLTPDQIVVLIAERSPDLLVGILAILKAGGAYLAIDPSFPEERKQYMLEDCGCRLLLVQRELKGDIDAERIWYLDDELSYHEDDSNLDTLSRAENLAYVIYTSGSTGRPKGIMIEHHGLTHFFAGFVAQLPFQSGQRILGLATVSFDIFIVESLFPLSLGMTIVLASEQEKNDPSRLSRLLTEEQVDVLQLTPSRFKWWSAQSGAAEAFGRLSLLMIGAEPLTPSVWHSLKACLNPSARIFNLYGPTETTVWASAQEVTEERNPITIGRGLMGAVFLVMNADGQLQPDGIPGELYIGGAGLGQGYMNRPDLTEIAFVEHRYCRKGKLYRTGDIVKKLPNGEFLYIGRKDFQVKIRGYRIELGEIEQVLLAFSGIREAVIHTIPVAGQEEQMLCAYIVGEEKLDASKLRQYLAEQLPTYMIPSYMMRLDAIPLTPTGKVDRKSLPDPTKHPAGMLQVPPSGGEQEREPQNEKESALFNVWEKLLGHRSFHRNQSFFEAGGSSIMIIRVCSQLEQEGWKLAVEDMFRFLTIASTAPLLKRTASVFQEWSLFSGTIEGKVDLISQQQAYMAKAYASTSGRVYDNRVVYRPGGFNERLLSFVLGRLMEQHDALRIAYFPKGREVTQYNQGMFTPLYKLDISELPKDQPSLSFIEQIVEDTNRRRDRFSDCRLETHLFKGEAGDYLAVMGDPLVMDAVSWNILIEDLFSAYKQADASLDIRLPAKTNSFQLYSKIIEEKLSGHNIGYYHDVSLHHTAMHRHRFSLDKELSNQLTSSFANEIDEWIVENILAHSLLQALSDEGFDEQVHIRIDGRNIDMSGLSYSRTIGRMDQVLTVALKNYCFEPDRPVHEIGIGNELREPTAEDGEEEASPRILIRMDKLATFLPDMEVINEYRQPTGNYHIEGSFGRFGTEVYVALDYANSEELVKMRRIADTTLKLMRDVIGWIE
ncbi:amino acid adenylation domain-containing protein [Paenibacillus sp. GSMTC-2017]|uniref:non-ribosomal peptide synthetase n=1 Tax=Paenibacillus sp. GSMTC-2017 TaxID=2794350 RepID=UPI0018D92F05|nr:amino acid adenylation domain-containing protein [Paenibacillus sp. GSMTC-2017]MBH5320504.1 amino acid adenylation domain-containing protein [Paenibacillus sp. GSMTC-2017]